MAITRDDVIALMNAFHDTVMYKKGTAAEQGAFFLHPEPRIFVPHGEDIPLQVNYKIHQGLTDERHVVLDPVDVTPLSETPERARAVCAVYWEGRPIDRPDAGLIKCVVGEDWIVQRLTTGELKIALYINSYHRFLPDSAPIDLA